MGESSFEMIAISEMLDMGRDLDHIRSYIKQSNSLQFGLLDIYEGGLRPLIIFETINDLFNKCLLNVFQVLAIVIDTRPNGKPKLTLFLSCCRDSRVWENNPVPARFQGRRMNPRPMPKWTLESLGELR